VTYQEYIVNNETSVMTLLESRNYKIDFDSFDSGVQAILAEDVAAPTPFGDFSKLDYILNANDAKYGELSDEVRTNLSDFLNQFNWGEEISEDQLTEEEKNRSEMKLHSLEWRSDDKAYGLAVMEIGYAVYNVQKVTYVEGYGEVLEPESVKLYRVDYEVFDKGLQAVLDINTKAPTEAFESADLVFEQHETLTPTDEEGKAKFEAFVCNDFVKMLEPTKSDDIVGNVQYSILITFKLDDNKMRKENYFVFTNGFVECREYKFYTESEESFLTDTEYYQIDIAELESVLKEEIGVELPEYREINISKAD
jgi:hypothetical protein